MALQSPPTTASKNNDDDENNDNNNNNNKILKFKTTYLMTRLKIANRIILHCCRVCAPIGWSPDTPS